MLLFSSPLASFFFCTLFMSVVVHVSRCACASQMVTCGGFGDKCPFSISHLADFPHHYYWWVVVVRGERHTMCVVAREQLSGSQFLPATVTWVLGVEVRLSGICSKCLSLLSCLTYFLCSFLFCLRLKPLVYCCSLSLWLFTLQLLQPRNFLTDLFRTLS